MESAAAFIARDSPRYAIVLQREAQASARSLRHFARRGAIVPERRDQQLRQLTVGNYRLIYRLVDRSEVHVIAFIHGARDLDRLLSDR